MDLQSAFPENFEFYNQGMVKEDAPSRDRDAWVIEPDSVAAAITLQGDVRGVFLLIFGSSLDFSTYSEMANVLAGKFVTELSEKNGQDVLISPPRRLSFEELCSLIVSDDSLVRTSYSHLLSAQDRPVSMQAVVVQVPSSGIGAGNA
jgi:chemotaxis protein CheY-P-specific phosphatase CheC